MTPYKSLLTTEEYYHVYNRAVGNEKIFRHADHYEHFLKLFTKYIVPCADVLCYNLLPNHFHFFLRTKSVDVIDQRIKKTRYLVRDNINRHNMFLIQQFSNMFNAYTKAFNKQQQRKGRLFIESFKHKRISSNAYYTKLIQYIHLNPVTHGICNTIDDWPYSSYPRILQGSTTWLKAEEVVGLFGSLEQFEEFHLQSAATSEVLKTSEV